MTTRSAASATPQITLHWEGRRTSPPVVAPATLEEVQRFSPAGAAPSTNALYQGDNLPILAALRERGERFDLIYVDPPYGSGVNWARKVRLRGRGGRAVLARIPEYGDTFDDAAYLQFLQDRLFLLRDLLAPSGTIWLHCDHRHAHHLRMLMDEIFGAENWLNSLAWRSQTARGAKASARFFPYSAHTLHLYARNQRERPTWNPPKRRTVLTESEAAAIFMRDEQGFFRTSDPGDYTFESLVRLHGEGRLYAPYGGAIVIDELHRRIYASHGGNIGVKYYLGDLGDGKYLVERTVDNLWEDIPGLGTTPGEDTGYPTQKTSALLERIIATATNEGDSVLDPFCGSGTTVAVAQRMNRRWCAIDLSPRSIQIATQRLYEAAAEAEEANDRSRAFSILRQSSDEGADAVAEESDVPEPTLLITRNALDATRIRVDLVGWRSERLLALLEDPDVDWRCMVDLIEIDVNYRPDRPLQVTIADAPVRRNRLVSGTYEVVLPRPDAVVALRITDILGDQATATIEP